MTVRKYIESDFRPQGPIRISTGDATPVIISSVLPGLLYSSLVDLALNKTAVSTTLFSYDKPSLSGSSRLPGSGKTSHLSVVPIWTSPPILEDAARERASEDLLRRIFSSISPATKGSKLIIPSMDECCYTFLNLDPCLYSSITVLSRLFLNTDFFYLIRHSLQLEDARSLRETLSLSRSMEQKIMLQVAKLSPSSRTVISDLAIVFSFLIRYTPYDDKGYPKERDFLSELHRMYYSSRVLIDLKRAYESEVFLTSLFSILRAMQFLILI